MNPTKKMQCLVVDDEPPAREILILHIGRVDELYLAGSCGNALEANSLIKEIPVDLLFLDINMPQLLGTDFIRTLKTPPKVIFTTAYRKYAVEGFELDAVDYLLKPISFERFLKAINKVMQTNLPPADIQPHANEVIQPSNSFLYFRVDRKMVKVFFNEILFIEALKDYIKIVTNSKVIVTKFVLSTIEELLPAKQFIRIHKSFIVNVQKIESYDTDSIQISKYELPIGRMYKLNVTSLPNNL